MKMTHKGIQGTAAVIALISLLLAQSSCNHTTSPGWEYMPDMANAITYETYSPNTFFGDSMSARMPVTGTIPRGTYMPFHFAPPPSTAGYDSAGLLLHFPAWLDTNSLADGNHIFTIYCAVCHGITGLGDGTIVNNPNIKNPFPPPPSYFDAVHIDLPEGKMYYSVHYGKNLMGPYSKVLNPNEVWKVVYYVKSMQIKAKQTAAAAAAKTGATASADTTKKSATTTSADTTKRK